jgi:hypothetical protein
MQSMLDQIMGPLGEEYCTIFYVLGLLAAFAILITVFNFMYGLFFTKGFRLFDIINTLMVLFMQFIAYYIYRVFYNVCKASL